MALRYNIQLTEDEDYQLRVQWKTKTNGNGLTPVDITPYTFSLCIYDKTGLPLDLVPCTKENGYVVFTYDADDIAQLPATAAKFKLKAEGPNNRVLLNGWIKVVKDA